MTVATVLPAYGAETVTLQSGFSLTCASRVAISTDMVRLFFSGGNGNYMDVPLHAIASVEAPQEAVVPAEIPQPSPLGLSALLQRSGAAHNVNTALLASVVKAESSGNAHAVSRAGARGLMQLMPGTAAALHVMDSFQPDQNLNGGSAYLDALLTRYHDNVAFALAAYNAGPRAVDRYHGIPPFRETRQYVARVLTEFNRRVREEARTSGKATAAVVPPHAGL